jgi:hypothetical protein
MILSRLAIACLFISVVSENVTHDVESYVLQGRTLKGEKATKTPKESQSPNIKSTKQTKGPKNPKVPKQMVTKTVKSVKKEKGSKELKAKKDIKTKEPTNAPTLPPVIPVVPTLQFNNNPVTVIITTDDYPQETSYQVQNINGEIFMAGGSYTEKRTTYIDTKNLPSGFFTFIIDDSYGDGICCAFGNGGYNLFVNDSLVKVGGIFTSTESVVFSTGSSPTIPPTSSPTNPPTNPPSACGFVDISITTDDYPTETSYEIKDQSGKQVMSGGNYTGKRTTYSDSSCLPHAVYEFIIRDSYGDGICCTYGNGIYNLFVNNVVVKTGGLFTFSESVSFSSQGAPFIPSPTSTTPPAPNNPPTFTPTNSPTVAPTDPPVPVVTPAPTNTPTTRMTWTGALVSSDCTYSDYPYALDIEYSCGSERFNQPLRMHTFKRNRQRRIYSDQLITYKTDGTLWYESYNSPRCIYINNSNRLRLTTSENRCDNFDLTSQGWLKDINSGLCASMESCDELKFTGGYECDDVRHYYLDIEMTNCDNLSTKFEVREDADFCANQNGCFGNGRK